MRGSHRWKGNIGRSGGPVVRGVRGGKRRGGMALLPLRLEKNGSDAVPGVMGDQLWEQAVEKEWFARSVGGWEPWQLFGKGRTQKTSKRGTWLSGIFGVGGEKP